MVRWLGVRMRNIFLNLRFWKRERERELLNKLSPLFGFKMFLGRKKLLAGKENEKRCNKDRMLKLLTLSTVMWIMNYRIMWVIAAQWTWWLNKQLITVEKAYRNYEKILVGDFNTQTTNHYSSSFLYQHELSSIVKEGTGFKNYSNPSCIDLFLTNSTCHFSIH